MDFLGAYTMQSQLTGSDESTFLYHTSCPSCGSSDGNSVYSDGHTYCFVCNHFDSGEPHDDCERPQKPIMLQGTPTKLRKRGLSEETCRKYRIRRRARCSLWMGSTTQMASCIHTKWCKGSKESITEGSRPSSKL
jgi:hypothetical protein